jgi:DMSO/TMAO reductase YedYZ molybdopterin-dependent catalytic subunit
MSDLSRRKLIAAGLGTAAGASGLAAAVKLADQYGLIPPDHGGIYGPGEALTYASQRLLTRHSKAREFSRDQISNPPFANELGPLGPEYEKHQAAGFADWRLSVDGMVARPGSFSLADLKRLPARSHITHLACEEGWSYIAEWTGVPLSFILEKAGIQPQAKFVAYFSSQKGWWDSLDMDDALHPQTLIAYGLNGKDLPTAHGGPMRMRVPRQLGYKSVKFINRLKVTDTVKDLGKGLGSGAPEAGYAWYAGI